MKIVPIIETCLRNLCHLIGIVILLSPLWSLNLFSANNKLLEWVVLTFSSPIIAFGFVYVAYHFRRKEKQSPVATISKAVSDYDPKSDNPPSYIEATQNSSKTTIEEAPPSYGDIINKKCFDCVIDVEVKAEIKNTCSVANANVFHDPKIYELPMPKKSDIIENSATNIDIDDFEFQNYYDTSDFCKPNSYDIANYLLGCDVYFDVMQKNKLSQNHRKSKFVLHRANSNDQLNSNIAEVIRKDNIQNNLTANSIKLIVNSANIFDKDEFEKETEESQNKFSKNNDLQPS